MSGDSPSVKQSSKSDNDPEVLLEFGWPGRLLAVLLICAFGVALLYSLSLSDVWSIHEGRVVGAAQNMLKSGDFWVPTLNGDLRLEKSPLVYWIVAASGATWGQLDEFSARLPSLLVGLACVSVTILIGRTLLNNTTALLAGLVQMSIFVYWRDCRTAEVDLYLTFFVSLAMLAFCRFHFAGSRRAGWVMLFWVSLGCGAMSKNVLTVLPALASCGLAMFLCRPKAPQNQLQGSTGRSIAGASRGLWFWHAVAVVLFFIMALGWNYSMIQRFAVDARAVWQKEIDTVLLWAHSDRPVYFYLKYIFVWAFPVSVFVPASLAVVFFSSFRNRRKELLFLFVWIAVLILAYSIWPWGKKKSEYIQPMISAFALLTGLVWNRLLTKQKRGGFNLGDRLTLTAHSLLLVVCGLTAIGFGIVSTEVGGAIAVVGAGLILLGLLSLIVKAGRVSIMLWGTIFAVLAAMITNFVWFLPRMNAHVSPRIFAQRVAKYGGQEGKVIIYRPGLAQQPPGARKKQGVAPLNFYLGYDTPCLITPSELKGFLADQPSGLVITAAKNMEFVPSEDLDLKVLYQQDMHRPSVPLTSDRLPEAWREPIDRALSAAQRPMKYTLLLGAGR